MGCGGSKIDWMPVESSLDENQKDFISAKLKQNASFQEFYDLNIDDLLPNMTMKAYSKGTFIFRKGDVSDALYFILKGQCQVYQADKPMGLLSKGSVVGEMGMIHGVKRTFSLQAYSDDCTMIRIMKEGYNRLTAEHERRKESLNHKLLSRATLFHDIPGKYYNILEENAKEINFREGQMILTKDQMNENIYIIKSGLVTEEINRLDSGEKDTTTLGQYSCFGEESILNETVPVNIVAAEYTSTLVFDFKTLKYQLPEDVISKITENAKQKKKLLKRLKSFSEMSVVSANSTRKRSQSLASNGSDISFGDEESSSQVGSSTRKKSISSNRSFSETQKGSFTEKKKSFTEKKKSFNDKKLEKSMHDFSFKDIPIVDDSNFKRQNSFKLKRTGSNRSLMSCHSVQSMSEIESKSVDNYGIRIIDDEDDDFTQFTNIMCCMQPQTKTSKKSKKKFRSKLE